ncbi:TonB-dependent receptor [Carboxylicivirga sp. A043]|uniref:TonB-dependent receptor plug domain-containing protein n=1 Tax=Carboxylicivirga litoralis TaxID=2816963 RepID=UPI0021CB3903|nr:TonB-dependent receptor [Carboxylicivirga sp. A043]MCU4156772.1 TonB-dependent receptor [Carboxylicivirga sp. A043]
MKLRIAISILLAVQTISQLSAQYQVNGKVTAKDSAPLVGVNITIKGTYDGTITDTNGKFTLALEDEQATLLISYIGYQTKEIEVNKKTPQLSVVLKESVTSLNAVTITAGTFSAGDKKRATVLEPLDIYTTAGSLGDINGALKTLPGTQPASDDGRLLVRGGEAAETKVHVDGLLAAKPYYSKVPDLPTRGRFAPSLFSGTVFSTGGYSAEYGQALSSILILESNDIAIEEITSLSIMSVGGEASKTWCAPNRSTSAGVAYTNMAPYYGLANNRLDWVKPTEAMNFNFMHRQKGKNGSLLKVFSTFDYGVQEFNTSLGNAFTNIDIEGGSAYINMNYSLPVLQNSCLKAGLASTIDNNRQIAGFHRTVDKELNIEGRLSFNHPLSDAVDVKLGVSDAFTRYRQDYTQLNASTYSNARVDDHIAGVFIEPEIRLSAELAVRPGLRYEYSSYLKESSWSPRVSAAYKTGKNSQLTAAWGHFFQNPVIDYLKYTSNLEFEKAVHYLLGYQTGTLKKRLFRAEAYYKDYKQLISYSEYSNNFYNNLANGGHGYAKGIDIFFRDKESFKYTDYWLSYSYIDTKRHYRNYPDAVTPSYIAEHTFSAVGKYFIGTINTQVGATWVMTSGRPYHKEGDTKYMSRKAPYYNDLSLNLSHLTHIGDHFTIIHFSFSNILGREHLVGYQNIPSASAASGYIQMPILPDIKQFLFLGLFISINTK